MFELQDHGGPVMMQLLLQHCLIAGREVDLRAAELDESTHRVFLNDKMDLAQAEAIADLVEASIEATTHSTVCPLDGMFSQTVHALIERAIHLRMLVETMLDFPEEEVDFLEASDAHGQLANIRTAVDGMLA